MEKWQEPPLWCCLHYSNSDELKIFIASWLLQISKAVKKILLLQGFIVLSCFSCHIFPYSTSLVVSNTVCNVTSEVRHWKGSFPILSLYSCHDKIQNFQSSTDCHVLQALSFKSNTVCGIVQRYMTQNQKTINLGQCYFWKLYSPWIKCRCHQKNVLSPFVYRIDFRTLIIYSTVNIAQRIGNKKKHLVPSEGQPRDVNILLHKNK